MLKDRPVITIPDDHDVGQANIWGENGKAGRRRRRGPAAVTSIRPNTSTWCSVARPGTCPIPTIATPIERGISVYYTDLTVGGINFAIVEDRKFKSGPEGKIPKMGPRPDHINDPKYDRAAVDLPGPETAG